MSKQKQQFIRRMMTMSFVKNLLAVVFVVLALFAIFAIFSQLFLQAYFADITLQTIRTNNSAKDINTRVQHVNNITKQMDAIQAEYYNWSPSLATITAAIPSNITVTGFTLRQADGILDISGSAPDRDALLEFKAALESLDGIDTVTIPLSDLTRKDAIPFAFSLPFVY